MKKVFHKTILITLCLLLSVSCKQSVQEDEFDPGKERNKKKESLIRVNRYVTQRNQDLIQRFVERTGWKMKKSDTGLWYEITVMGKGAPLSEGDMVQYSFKSMLLDGTVRDSSAVKSPLTVRAGHGGISTGLEEALLLLREGDRARIIIPPHLAQGNFGDDKYPAGAILLYELHILKVQKEKRD